MEAWPKCADPLASGRAFPISASDIEVEADAISENHESEAELLAQCWNASVPSAAGFGRRLDQFAFEHVVGLPLASADDLADLAGTPSNAGLNVL
jgi:hypothetical protein